MPKLVKLSLTLLTTTILLLGFAVTVNPPNGTWYQQFMPNLNGANIIDITFTDSLTGYALTNLGSSGSYYLLKSTNSGDNWFTVLTDTNSPGGFDFINSNTGFIARGVVNGNDMVYRTTNGGNNWTRLFMPENGIAMDIEALSVDTIWVADPTPLNIGGLYWSSNSGVNWQRLYAGGENNPECIYMFNSRLGFMTLSQSTGQLYRTTNGGYNWSNVPGGEWSDIYFIDSLTGWKSGGGMKKTTDGGLNWVTQTLPNGGIILSNAISDFTLLSRDTIWGTGGVVFYGAGITRGIVYRTTNGGNNWLFQIPDTSYGLGILTWIPFINKNNGWAYHRLGAGIHTTNGGDTTFLVGLQQLASETPNKFRLFQNYPNPFNPVTNIKYQVISNSSNVKLVIFDITGREVVSLVDQKQNAGTYKIDFSGEGYASGVYFYRLTVTSATGGGKEVFTETRKMILIK